MTAGPPLRLVALVALLLLAVSAPHAAPITLTIEVEAKPGTTRLVLTHSEQVGYQIERTDGRIEILYDAPVLASPQQMRLEDDAPLRRYRMRGDQVLVLATGPAFTHHEVFELRNPFRLIIDLEAGVSGIEGARPQSPAAFPAPTRVPGRVVVIDPGHGGSEEGAIGPSGLKEKDVTLDLARQLKQRLQQMDPSLEVVLTRDEDRAVGLDERTAVANQHRAELFLSIHLNSARVGKAAGAETYYLSTEATDQEARALADDENRASSAGTAAPDEGAPRNLELVLWDLAQNEHLAESSALAESVQAQLNQLIGTRDRGVRQAPFRVLMGATMPAILVEVGFISNPAEEAQFQTAGYRNQVVEAIAVAVRGFLQKAERLTGREP